MSDPVITAYREFSAAHQAMLVAAEGVRAAVAAAAGLGGDGSESIATIQQIVARHYGFSRAEILTQKKTASLATTRQVAMWLCRTLTRHSLQEIGAAFQRDHGTVIWAVKIVGNRAGIEPRFASELLDLRHRCEAALEGRK